MNKVYHIFHFYHIPKYAQFQRFNLVIFSKVRLYFQFSTKSLLHFVALLSVIYYFVYSKWNGQGIGNNF